MSTTELTSSPHSDTVKHYCLLILKFMTILPSDLTADIQLDNAYI